MVSDTTVSECNIQQLICPDGVTLDVKQKLLTTLTGHWFYAPQQVLPVKQYLQGVRSDPVVSLRPHTASGATLHRSVSSPRADTRPYSAKSVPPPDHGAIFQLTEPADGEGSQEMDGGAYRKILTQLGNFQQDQSASRTKIICSMMAKQTGDKWRDLLGLIRKDGDDDDGEAEEEEVEEYVEDESFDYETSDAALSGLEAKIRQFHDRQDDAGRKIVPQIAELRRFSIEVGLLAQIDGLLGFVRVCLDIRDAISEFQCRNNII